MKSVLFVLGLAAVLGCLYGAEAKDVQVTAFTCDEKTRVDMPRPLTSCTKWCDRQYFTLPHAAYVECYKCCDVSMKYSTWGNQDRPGTSCKDIKKKRPDLKTVHDNGHYYIQPQKGGPVFKVYCDMLNGGLTLLANSRGGNRILDYDPNKHQEEFASGGATLDKPIVLSGDVYGHLAMNLFPIAKAALRFSCRLDPEDQWIDFDTTLFKDTKAGTYGVDDGPCGGKAGEPLCPNPRPGQAWGVISQVGVRSRYDNGICGRYYSRFSKPTRDNGRPGTGGLHGGIALCDGVPGTGWSAYKAGVSYASFYKHKGVRNWIYCGRHKSDSPKAQFKLWWTG